MLDFTSPFLCSYPYKSCKKSVGLLKRCSLSADCHLIALEVAQWDSKILALCSQSVLCKSFLVQLEAWLLGSPCSDATLKKWDWEQESQVTECSQLLTIVTNKDINTSVFWCHSRKNILTGNIHMHIPELLVNVNYWIIIELFIEKIEQFEEVKK